MRLPVLRGTSTPTRVRRIPAPPPSRVGRAAARLAATAASAASPSPTPSSNSASSSAAPTMPAHGTAAHENAEVAVTGANATKAQAAAVKALGGGTAGAVTTDFTKTGYEVTVTGTDGTTTEVHLDSSFNVMQGGRP